MERLTVTGGDRAVPFQIEEAVDDTGRLTLSLHGELDLASAPALRHRFGVAMRRYEGDVALDLHGLDFIDSTGVNALLLLREVCAERGSALSIVRPSAQVEHVFRLTGLEEMIAPRSADR